MDVEKNNTPQSNDLQDNRNVGKTIPVIEEQVRVDKKVVETGKVHVSKKVTEHDTTVTIPLQEETYDVERVPINQVVETAPAPVRYEGDTMIIPVVREVVVVQKHYEVIEEVRLTKKITQRQQTEQVTLKREQVNVERSSVDDRQEARDRNDFDR